MGAKVVCLDTMILIWGVKKEAAQGQEMRIKDAEAFLKNLEEEGAVVIIPAPVISEVLVRVPPDRVASVAEYMSAHFRVMPFDAPCAVVAAKLRQTIEGSGARKELTDSGRTWRQVKVDIQVAAVAIVHGAACLYSSDGEMAKVACGLIEVKDMPRAHVPELPFPIEGEAPPRAREAAQRVDKISE
jgi:predicted nucleic acid-binding protein